MRLVENDKIERREKEARKKQSKLANQQNSPVQAPEPGPSDSETAISFRLLDGTILKSKFPSSSKLTDVRRWLDKVFSTPFRGHEGLVLLMVLEPYR